MIIGIVIIHDILFDTGAGHGSYLSKNLEDFYKHVWNNNIKKAKTTVTLEN